MRREAHLARQRWAAITVQTVTASGRLSQHFRPYMHNISDSSGQ